MLERSLCCEEEQLRVVQQCRLDGLDDLVSETADMRVELVNSSEVVGSED